MIHEREWAELVAPRSDFEQLLHLGWVSARVNDTVAWRKQIKAQARAAGRRVRTRLSEHDPNVASALLVDSEPSSSEDLLADRFGVEAIDEAREQARRNGHCVSRMIRTEQTQSAGRCEACGARLYVSWRELPPFWEGEVFSRPCRPAPAP